ncbi:MAG: DNA repair protein RecO, partial [Candidatus Falkowbacteria bacterium]|nr:DNA repair protein RecO [Candidatus Falkowbacteria bacterium]
MQETYYTKAIILTREPFREYDSKIITYTLAKGKLELVARGTKKILSKLAGHLEPITLSDIMVIKGKQFNYVGTATSTNTFLQIKKNLEKLTIVGAAIKVFNELIKENEADKDIFSLLGIFLFLVNDNKTNLHQAKLLVIVFKIKLIILLGYQPLLDSCLVCGNKKIDN